MHVACSTSNDKIVLKLVKAGGSLVSPEDKFGRQPLDYGPPVQHCAYPMMQLDEEQGNIMAVSLRLITFCQACTY